jgi:HEAT repeat protein
VIFAIRHVLSCAKDGEVIAQCLKFMRESSDLPSVLTYLSHPDWIVRLQAVRGLGRIGTVEDSPKLLVLLSDPVWWVRYRTAQTLLELIRGDMQLVSDLRAQLGDRFALDMLDMVIAEKKKQ